MRAVLFALPEDVERFEPVLRRCRGAEALLAPGRFLPATVDSRALVREALRARGWLPRERATREFDRILTTSCVAPSAAAAWLAPGGRVVVWHEPGVGSRWHLGLGESARAALQPPIAAVVAPTREFLDGIHPEHATVVGDPLLDASFEPGAAGRARASFGLTGERPVVVVALERRLDPPWTAALAALRADVDVVLLPSDALWLGTAATGRWPRALTGPGIHLVHPRGTCRRADALAAADLVVGQRGAILHAAHRRGRRTLVIEPFVHSGSGPALDRPSVDTPSRLRDAVGDVLRDVGPDASETAGGARRLAEVLDAVALDPAML